MMSYRPVQLTHAPTRNTALTRPPAPIAPGQLDAHQRRLFAQRLAILIERIRAAKQEGIANDG
jgi:hypothetical protein